MTTHATTRKLVTAGALLVLSCVMGCGGGNSDSITNEDAAKSVLSELSASVSTEAWASAAKWYPFLQSKNYTGAIVAHFRETAGVRFEVGTNQWTSRTGADVAALNTLQRVVPSATVRRSLKIDEATVDAVRDDVRRRGKTFPDWNSTFVWQVSDPAQAEQVLAVLYGHNLVEWAHPQPRLQYMTVPHNLPAVQAPSGSGGPSPVLTKAVLEGDNDQGYLRATGTGLNVDAATALDLRGEGQTVIDAEGNWNYAHVNLQLDPKKTTLDGITSNTMYPDQLSIQHGTGVLGIVGAHDLGNGIVGIAPAVEVRTFSPGVNGAGFLAFDGALSLISDYIQLYTDNGSIGDNLGGQVVLIEGAAAGQNVFKDCFEQNSNGVWSPTGCLPPESYGDEFDVIQSLQGLGAVVVEGSVNGNVNLDDPKQQATDCSPKCKNLGSDDSGALMVGASMGTTLDREPTSNYGKRVNVFAWGKDVVTIGALTDTSTLFANPNDPNPVGDHPLSVPGDLNRQYTKTFSGTSASTAIIGGVVALLEQYTQKLYTDPAFAAQEGVASLKLSLKKYEHVYLDAAQVREILTDPDVGVSSTSPTTPIGLQPDVGKALQKITEKMLTSDWRPTIAVKALGTKGKCVYTEDWSPECAEECLAVYAQKNYSFTDLPKLCPKGGRMFAKAMDVDGVKDSGGVVDNQNGKLRADLVAWGRDGKWYLDLSGTNPLGTPDGFGQWDLVLTPPPMAAGRLFPMVADYDSDGLADLALYNTDTGHWYIKYTTPAVLSGTFGDWDEDLDFKSNNPTLGKAGARPEVGDYDGVLFTLNPTPTTYQISPMLDLALVGSNGSWFISYADATLRKHSAKMEPVKILSNEQLQQAPAWAYLPVSAYYDYYHEILYTVPDDIQKTTPDGTTESGRLCGANYPAPLLSESKKPFGCYVGSPYGASNNNMIPGRYDQGTYDCIGVRASTGAWQIVDPVYGKTMQVAPPDGFGDASCRPIPADYDGDNKDDRAVLCPNGAWKLTYSDEKFTPLIGADGFRQPALSLGGVFQSLPGRVYPGGVKYQDLKSLFSKYNFGCAKNKTCTIFDLPAPIGPYFAECLQLWGTNPVACLKY